MTSPMKSGNLHREMTSKIAFKKTVDTNFERQNTLGTVSHLETELSKLKENVSSLSKENVQWKILNNQLFNFAIDQTVDK